jgi:hypothetical protein
LVLENGELMSMVGWIEDLSSTCWKVIPKLTLCDVDGWYWFEERLDVKLHFLNNKPQLLQLITWVSDYEF